MSTNPNIVFNRIIIRIQLQGCQQDNNTIRIKILCVVHLHKVYYISHWPMAADETRETEIGMKWQYISFHQLERKTLLQLKPPTFLKSFINCFSVLPLGIVSKSQATISLAIIWINLHGFQTILNCFIISLNLGKCSCPDKV